MLEFLKYILILNFVVLFIFKSPIEIVLPEAGPLTQTMIAFLQEMNNSTGRSSTVNPTPLFSQICKK